MAELNANISLVEFPDIGHADLVECPADAVRIVTEFFQRRRVPPRTHDRTPRRSPGPQAPLRHGEARP